MKKSNFTVERVFENNFDKLGHVPTTEECEQIKKYLTKLGISVDSGVKNFYKNGNDLESGPPFDLSESLPERKCKSIKLHLKDGTTEINTPLFLISPVRQTLSEISYPHNTIKQTHDGILFLIENYAFIYSEKTIKFSCNKNDLDRNLELLHSACLFIEFFQKLGWKVNHWFTDGISETGKSTYGYELRLGEQKLCVYINLLKIHILTMEAYDSIRISQGGGNPSDLLARHIIEQSFNEIWPDYFQFYCEYHYDGKDMLKMAFFDLNDVRLDDFHDYLIEHIVRALTPPWTNEKVRSKMVNFILSLCKTNRYNNFERWMLKTYDEVRELSFAKDILQIIENNYNHQLNYASLDEHLLINTNRERLWKISELNNLKYKKAKFASRFKQLELSENDGSLDQTDQS